MDKNDVYKIFTQDEIETLIDDYHNSDFADFDLTPFFDRPFPNGSELIDELRSLRRLPSSPTMVVKYDDVFSNFEDICERIGVEFPRVRLKEVLQESRAAISLLKAYYNRPRPWQSSLSYGIDVGNVIELDSMRTPSYPSGHSTQAMLTALILSNEYPNRKAQFIELAKRISYSRNVGRGHYSSDSKFGFSLAVALYGYLSDTGIV